MRVNAAPTTPRRRPRWTRLRALLALGLLCGGGATVTLAGWTDQEGAAATFGAATLEPPLLEGCRISSVLGIAPTVRIYWTPPDGYDREDAILEVSEGGDGAEFTRPDFDLAQNTVSNPDSQYDGELRTKVDLGLLSGLLNLNSEVELALSITTDPADVDAWTSQRAIVVADPGTLLGLNTSCRI